MRLQQTHQSILTWSCQSLFCRLSLRVSSPIYLRTDHFDYRYWEKNCDEYTSDIIISIGSNKQHKTELHNIYRLNEQELVVERLLNNLPLLCV